MAEPPGPPVSVTLALTLESQTDNRGDTNTQCARPGEGGIRLGGTCVCFIRPAPVAMTAGLVTVLEHTDTVCVTPAGKLHIARASDCRSCLTPNRRFQNRIVHHGGD